MVELVLCGGKEQRLPWLALLRLHPPLGQAMEARSSGPGALGPRFCLPQDPGGRGPLSRVAEAKVPALAMPPDVVWLQMEESPDWFLGLQSSCP